MSLTTGPGPLAHANRGRSDTDLSTVSALPLALHGVSRRIRGVVAGEVVVDTECAVLRHETGLRRQWCVPREDVRTDPRRLLRRPAAPRRTPRVDPAVGWARQSAWLTG